MCAKIENIFSEAIKKFVPEIVIPRTPIELSKKSLNLLKKKKILMRRKHCNTNNHNIMQIKSQLKLVNQLLMKSISDDYKIWWINKITKIKPDNNFNLFKNIKQMSNYKKKSVKMNTLCNNDKSELYIYVKH